MIAQTLGRAPFGQSLGQSRSYGVLDIVRILPGGSGRGRAGTGFAEGRAGLGGGYQGLHLRGFIGIWSEGSGFDWLRRRIRLLATRRWSGYNRCRSSFGAVACGILGYDFDYGDASSDEAESEAFHPFIALFVEAVFQSDAGQQFLEAVDGEQIGGEVAQEGNGRAIIFEIEASFEEDVRRINVRLCGLERGGAKPVSDPKLHNVQHGSQDISISWPLQ